MNRTVVWTIAILVFAGAFLVRMLEFAFHNDHFEFLSVATEILHGAVPGIDYFDPSRPLQQYLSAAGLLFGHQLLAEALFCVAVLSIAAAVVFLLGLELTGAMSLGLLASTFVVAMLPRLYSYPKIIVPALGLLACWRYIDRPSFGRLAAVSLITAVAFYLRFDYGALLGLAVAAALMVRHWQQWRSLFTAALQYGAVVVLLCAPYVLLQLTAGVLSSGPGSGRLTHLLRGDDVVSLAVPDIPDERPLVWFRPAGPLATVRWNTDVSDVRREGLEQRYSLQRVKVIDEHAWQYVLLDRSPEALVRLMADEAVDGVTNVDSQGRILREPPWSVVRRWIRMPVLESPLLNERTAAVWLYDVLFLTPLLAAGVLLVRSARGRARAGETAKVVAAIAISVLFNVSQIRGNLDSRLADVIVPAALLWVWMAWIFLAPPAGVSAVAPAKSEASAKAGRPLQIVKFGVAAVALLSIWLGIDVYAGSVNHLEASELFSTPRNVARRFSGTIQGLRANPLDQFAPPGSRGVAALTRYVNRCTQPSDFLLVIGYQPEMYFYADRRIGGGNVAYHANLGATPEQQETIVRRLQGQSVPIVIMPLNEVREFEEAYPIVKRYVDERYQVAQESGFGDDRPIRVLVDRRASPTRIDEELELPCFRDTKGTK